MGSLDPQRQHAREMLAALRARLELVAADPAAVTSSLTIRESSAFVRMLYRCGCEPLRKSKHVEAGESAA